MKILAIDSSTSTASVAITSDGKLLSEFSLNDGYTHSKKLVPMIDTIMEYLSLEVADMDYIAASIGPGSFTGLRIGVVTAKTMALATGKETVGVPTLDALAFNVTNPNSLICPIIDARNNQVYTAIYKSEVLDEMPVRLTDYVAVTIDDLAEMLAEQLKAKEGMKVVMVGNGVKEHEVFFKEKLKNTSDFAGLDKVDASAASVARVAELMVKQGKITPSDDLVPFYLRKSSAERLKENNDRL